MTSLAMEINDSAIIMVLGTVLAGGAAAISWLWITVRKLLVRVAHLQALVEAFSRCPAPGCPMKDLDPPSAMNLLKVAASTLLLLAIPGCSPALINLKLPPPLPCGRGTYSGNAMPGVVAGNVNGAVRPTIPVAGPDTPAISDMQLQHWLDRVISRNPETLK